MTMLSSSRSQLLASTSSRPGARAVSSRRVFKTPRAASTDGADAAGAGASDEDTDAFNARNLSVVAQRIEAMKRASTLRFLQRGYQADVLEGVAEALLECRPQLPEGGPSAMSLQELEERRRAHTMIEEWHEDAYRQLQEVVHGSSSDNDS